MKSKFNRTEAIKKALLNEPKTTKLIGAISSELCQWDSKKQKEFLIKLEKLMIQYDIDRVEIGWKRTQCPS